ncbi:MAG: hypothetical protein OIF50_04415 [Flavobacteriaceae bacterium]|nr:hypothetical protein [Flavobacteriaceae bacterium]
MKTIDRIMIFIEHLNISVRQFDLSIGASNGYTLRMKKNNASVGSDVIENIAKKYPEVSIEWLVTGRGQMLKESFQPKFDPEASSLENVVEKMIFNKMQSKKKTSFKNQLKDILTELKEKNKD